MLSMFISPHVFSLQCFFTLQKPPEEVDVFLSFARGVDELGRDNNTEVVWRKICCGVTVY